MVITNQGVQPIEQIFSQARRAIQQGETEIADPGSLHTNLTAAASGAA